MSENVGTAIRLMKHKCPNCGGDLETVVSATRKRNCRCDLKQNQLRRP